MTRTNTSPGGAGRETTSRRELLQFAGWAVGAGGALAARAVGQEAEPEGGPAVWLGMTQAELDAAYDQRAYAPNRDRIAEQETQRNEAARVRLGPAERFAYGTGEGEGLDVYRPSGPGAPVHVYLHGGTWRFGAAAEFAYVAEPLVRLGAAVVIPDFSPVHEVEGGLAVLARQVREAVAWTYRNAERFGGDPSRIYVSGHSSGGHLAGVVLTTDWPGAFGLPDDLVKGGLCASGMFDLEPVRLSWRNEYLHLTDETIQALSPQRHIERLKAPLLVAYGTYETPEFQRHSRDFAAAVEASGKPVELLVGAGYNHFEIRLTLGSPYGLLGYAVSEQMGLATGV